MCALGFVGDTEDNTEASCEPVDPSAGEAPSGGTCYTLYGKDSYGDGWNGAYWTWYNNGVLMYTGTVQGPSESLGLIGGQSGYTDHWVLCADGCAELELSCTDGYCFSSEISWEMVDSSGATIAEGEGDTSSQSIDCAPPTTAPTAQVPGCAESDCGPDAGCVDMASGYECSCNPGYEGSTTMNAPAACTDYDACSDTTVDCGTGASCVDAVAPATGYQCECDPGYEGTSMPNAAATCTEEAECVKSGTFITNEGNHWYSQTPFEYSSNLFIFGGYDGGWFKMQSVHADGSLGQDRYTSAISTISQLTTSIWDSANIGGYYNVIDVVLGPC
jgi:hypothetical protein